ncbi:hypothetical protein Mp_5g09090 [Marchantia polymorpha subsp. ruderalis]|uniref:tRNA:m(4)X modification enzyme TRM13 n=2 Tax=Marchantia polymorpha TaxID=3197 RepID=A0AAF6BGH1_MARPO|nr:hypothetical protein MARPO_0095s0050 [Marchantia polymorpha]BBN11105.1 hypothetical protein Mp_5g09090 [Marchantia polymorpha subsp. ruderalis]|eukprot:PTQ32792.1 hypothetical protein MARPO_0095s0050 [Marchantia polymorpha]
MWLPSKRRFCGSSALATSPFCGNHDPAAGEKRVPCPVDPSHTVLHNDVAAHVKRCQATKHMKFSEEQPYYCKGINAGSDGEEDGRASRDDHDCSEESRAAAEIPPAEIPPADPPRENGACGKTEQRVEFLSSAAKRSAITALSERQFLELVRRIESAHEASRSETVEESFLQPPQCLQWWDRNRDKRLPFKEKHVSQQASMLGNFEAFGLLKRDGAGDANDDSDSSKAGGDCESRAFVEFGAGRGYLSHMLCDSYGVSSVVLVERKAYKYKADRTLRQLTGVSVERLRTDIEDLSVRGVPALQGRRYVAVSKHLCGPATDLTLRCCLNEAGSSDPTGLDSSPVLEGVGIATCCHHLCQWRSYVNKPYFREIGFSEADFNMITWLTSWAVNESGDHAEVEIPEAQKIPDHRVVPDGTSPGAQIFAPRLSEVMDAMEDGARAELGRKCKHLIDFGRLLFLRRHGMSAKIVKYISATVSPENKLLLGRRIFA